MDCEEFRRVAADWENGTKLEESAYARARAHARSCASCRAAQRPFLALSSREDGGAVRSSASGLSASALADRVMAEIGTVDRRSTRRAPIRRLPRFSAAAAAALVIALTAALAVGIAVRDAGTVIVRFRLEAPGASSVFLAGSFSSWRPTELALRKTADGVWERAVRLKRGQSYAYNFVVDGETWIVDPAANERVEDGFGGESALLRL